MIITTYAILVTLLLFLSLLYASAKHNKLVGLKESLEEHKRIKEYFREKYEDTFDEVKHLRDRVYYTPNCVITTDGGTMGGYAIITVSDLELTIGERYVGEYGNIRMIGIAISTNKLKMLPRDATVSIPKIKNKIATIVKG